MNTIKYTTNWNNKLDCKHYTTLRIYNPIKHQRGKIFDVFINSKLKHKAEIIGVKKGYLKDLGSYDCYLDTGYSKQETISLMQKFYPKIDFKHQLVVLLLFKKIEPPKPIQKELFPQN